MILMLLMLHRYVLTLPYITKQSGGLLQLILQAPYVGIKKAALLGSLPTANACHGNYRVH
jgi:hypothetical protein